jgi:signal transduction histidine kinase
MTLIAIGRGMGAGARPNGVHRSMLVLGIGAALVALGVVGVAGFGAEHFWSLHANDASLRSAIETGITLSVLVSAMLLLAHFRQTRLLRDLLLLAALATAALTEFVFNALPAYNYQTGIYGAGARVALSVLVASIFLAVAFVPAQRRVATGRRLVKIAVPAAICWLAVGELVDLIVGPVRAQGLAGNYGPISLMMSLIGFTVLVVAACGFVERRRRGDAEAGLLAGAAILIAGAHLARLALPVVPPDWVMPGDVLRVGAYGFLLAASVRMYGRSRDQMARDALTAERRRIARDLHDGLAQDLAFIAAHSERLAQEYGADHPLAVAAARALAASRGKIIDLEASSAPSTEAALREVAAEFGSRFGVDVTVSVDGVDRLADGDRSERDRRELVRITREAIANAVRHGGAQHVEVTLGSKRDDLMLRITDDGCGFAGADGETAGMGLGMSTMVDRARQLGAALRAGPGDRGGTKIDVITLPARGPLDV